MGFGKRALSALGKIGIALSVIVIFIFGFLGTIYLSLHTAEVKVPDVLGKDRFAGESALGDAGLNIRVARTRASLDKKPDTILWQYPEGGQIVKTGQTVAVEVSRAPKEGESVPSSTESTQQEADKPAENTNANQTSATNLNQNQSKPKNKNKNSNNANNANNKNSNNSNNANRNANNRNTEANRNANNSNNRNSNTSNANRNNANANKRPPVTTPPKPGANKGTP